MRCLIFDVLILASGLNSVNCSEDVAYVGSGCCELRGSVSEFQKIVGCKERVTPNL